MCLRSCLEPFPSAAPNNSRVLRFVQTSSQTLNLGVLAWGRAPDPAVWDNALVCYGTACKNTKHLIRFLRTTLKPITSVQEQRLIPTTAQEDTYMGFCWDWLADKFWDQYTSYLTSHSKWLFCSLHSFMACFILFWLLETICIFHF